MRAEVQLIVRVHPSIRRALEKIKKTTGRPISVQVRDVLTKYIKEQPAQNPAE